MKAFRCGSSWEDKPPNRRLRFNEVSVEVSCLNAESRLLARDLEMILRRILRLLRLLFICSGGGLCAVAVKAASLESLRVVNDPSSAIQKLGPSKPATTNTPSHPAPLIAQSRTLSVTLRNSTSETASAGMRYWVFRRDMRTQKLSVLDGWEKVITLNPRQTEIFSTEEMQSQYRPKGLLKSSAMATKTPTVGPPTAAD
jgi:hypothetical protein